MYIAIVTHDIEYATRLISYIRYEKKHIPYSFQLFTNVDHFLFNGQKTSCQMVIIDEHLLKDYKESKASQLNIPLLVVTESNLTLEDETLFKFRPAPVAFNEIQKRLESRHHHIAKMEHTQVIVVSSFLAGVGKTTAALALADELVKKGQQVFYFNLERWISDDLYNAISDQIANEANLSKLYYLQQMNQSQCTEWLQKSVFILPEHSCYSLYPFVHQDDRLKLQNEEAISLLQSLKESQLFDTIIIDLESGYDALQATIIGEADTHFICTQASPRMQKKHLQELEHLNKQLQKEVFKKLEHAIYLTQSSQPTSTSLSTHPNTVYIPRLEDGQNPMHSTLYRSALQYAIKKIGAQAELQYATS